MSQVKQKKTNDEKKLRENLSLNSVYFEQVSRYRKILKQQKKPKAIPNRTIKYFIKKNVLTTT